MDPGIIAVFIPIVAIIMGIGIGMLAIWSEHKRKAQLLEQNHRERMHAIEKGIELPPLPANLVGISNGPATASAAKSLRGPRQPRRRLPGCRWKRSWSTIT